MIVGLDRLSTKKFISERAAAISDDKDGGAILQAGGLDLLESGLPADERKEPPQKRKRDVLEQHHKAKSMNENNTALADHLLSKIWPWKPMMIG